MIDVVKACDIISNTYNNKVYISKITEIDKGYVIGVIGLNGEEYEEPPRIVYKENGEWGVFFPPHHIEELKNKKIIDIPEKYKAPENLKTIY